MQGPALKDVVNYRNQFQIYTVSRLGIRSPTSQNVDISECYKANPIAPYFSHRPNCAIKGFSKKDKSRVTNA